MAFVKEKLEMFVNKSACVKHGRKHRYIKSVSLLLAAVLLCGMTGCSKNEEQISDPEGSLSGSQSIPNESSASDDTSVESSSDVSQDIPADSSVSDSVSSEQVDSSAKINIDEAVKDITLFGHKISLPCTIKDLGEDFSLGAEGTLFENGMEFDGKLMIDILYKGDILGAVTLPNYRQGDELGDKQITSLFLGYATDKELLGESGYKKLLEMLGYYSDTIEWNMAGITFDSSKEMIFNALGEPDEIGDYISSDSEMLRYKFTDGIIEFGFVKKSLVVIGLESESN